jgi:ribosomal protein L2
MLIVVMVQASSTAHVGLHAGSHFEAAPAVKAGSKMRAASHFNSSSKGTGMLPVL